MELWEFNSCVKGYNDNRIVNDRLSFVRAWETAALTGNAFAGKLRKLDHYTGNQESTHGQVLTPEEMSAFDKKLQEQQARKEADK